MGKGRKKLPTKVKELQGTLQKCRTLEDEMEVAEVDSLPPAPMYLNNYGAIEWERITNQLYDINMLHTVDLALITAYCREMGTYLELAHTLNGTDLVERTYKDGVLRSSKPRPELRIMRESLDRALKIATQFGLTPSARASIQGAPKPKQESDEYNFF